MHRRRAAPAGDAPWLCHIKIKREYDAHGHPLHEVPPEQTFCTITNKEHIAICVTAAQASLLNPGATAQEEGGALAFVPSGLGGGGGAPPRHSDAFGRLGGGDYELEFTSNSVVLEIQGAEADLTIVDLPGIIQSHPKGEHYVGMIKEMVVR